MEDSGIDSDSRSNCNGIPASEVLSGFTSLQTHQEIDLLGVAKSSNNNSSTNEFAQFLRGSDVDQALCTNSDQSSVCSESPPARLISTSQLQKRLEKQIQQAKKIRQREQNNTLDSLPKKLLIPRSRLKVPSKNNIPVVTKADSHPLVSWESESEEEFEFHPMSKSAAREITQQLIKDGYNLDLTPDDEDLDLIPPKPLNQRCACCNMSYACSIQ